MKAPAPAPLTTFTAMRQWVWAWAVMVVCCSLQISAQPQHLVDSLSAALPLAQDDAARVQLMVQLAEAYLDIAPDSTLAIADRVLTMTEGKGQQRARAYAYRYKATATARLGSDRDAISLYRRALKEAEGLGSVLIEAGLYRNIGVAYYHLSQYDSALVSYFASLDRYRTLKDSMLMGGVLNNIGNIYYFNDFRKACEYYQQALEVYLKMGYTEGLAKQYGNLGLISMRMDDTLKAVEFSERSLQYSKEVGNPYSTATSHVNLADAYKLAGRYKEALWQANESLRIRTEISDKKGVTISTMTLGLLHYEMGQFAAGQAALIEALGLCKDLKLKNYEMETKELLARCLLGMGRQKDADRLFSQLARERDSISTADLHSKMAEMDTRYRTLEKDAEILKLNSQAEIDQLKLRRREYFLAGAATLTLLLSIMSFIVYGAYRTKQRGNQLLQARNVEISRQQKEITDSIRYAKTLQTAILSSEAVLRRMLPDPFILFRPRDIVSGDFYWCEEVEGRIYFAVVDCTGHGVPGAMVSLVGYNALNRTVKDLRLTQPSEILDKLSELVTDALNRDSELSVKDGMDMALCSYHPNTMILEYAGAYNPMLLVRNGDVTVLRANRQPVGMHSARQPFTNHRMVLQHDDRIFLCSDGFADQFGGPNDTKYGSRKLRELLIATSGLPMQHQSKELGKAFQEWKGLADQTDDVTVLGVRT